MKAESIVLKTVPDEALKELLNVKLPEGQELYIDRFAVWEDKIATDPDAVFWYLENKIIDDEIQKAVDIECRIKHLNEEGGYSMRMDMPDFVKTVSLKSFLEVAEDVKFSDFIRMNYNPRINSNQNLLLKHIKNPLQL